MGVIVKLGEQKPQPAGPKKPRRDENGSTDLRELLASLPPPYTYLGAGVAVLILAAVLWISFGPKAEAPIPPEAAVDSPMPGPDAPVVADPNADHAGPGVPPPDMAGGAPPGDTPAPGALPPADTPAPAAPPMNTVQPPADTF